MQPDLDAWYFGPFASIAFVYVGAALTTGRSTIVHAWRSWAARKQAFAARAAAESEAAILDEGDTVLRGVVEYAPDHDRAMSVTIDQGGSEAESSGSWTVTWTEQDRKTIALPFIVVHQSGERVRVEPDTNARLEKEVLTRTERVGHDHRTRTAELVAGEEVWVTGLLRKETSTHGSGGYRGGRAWVMRPMRDDPMVVSTLTPERRFVRDMKVARLLAVLFAFVLAGTMAFEWRFHALLFSGRDAIARVTSISNISVEDGPDRCDLHIAVTERGGTRTFDDDWDTACTQPAVVKDASFPAFASFGSLTEAAIPENAARARVAPMIIGSIAWIILAIISFFTRTKSNWWDGARVVDSESGRLT